MRYSILFLLLSCPQLLFAQFTLKKSIEIPLTKNVNRYHVVPAGEEGVILYRESRNYESNLKRKWEINCLTKDFELNWTTQFESHLNFIITDVKYYEKFIYLLFQDINTPSKSVLFVRTSIENDNFEFFEIKEFLPREIVGFEMLGNSLFLIGIDFKRPSIIRFNFGNPSPQALSVLYKSNNELLHINVFPDQKVIQIITRMKKQRGDNYILVLKQFDEFGEVKKDIRIESSKEYNLLNAMAQTDAKGVTCVVGTFSQKKTNLSVGIFTTVIKDESEHSLHFYSYTNLHNFFSYLPQKKREKIRRKYLPDTLHTKKSAYKTYHLPRALVKTNDSWQYVGGNVMPNDRNSEEKHMILPFEFQKYSHAIALGIGENGRLQWDKGFIINENASNSDPKQLNIHQLRDQSLLYYTNNANNKFNIFSEHLNSSEMGKIEMVELGKDFTNAEGGSAGWLYPWYDDYFIVCGSYNYPQDNSKNRGFFFLNKLMVSPSSAMDEK